MLSEIKSDFRAVLEMDPAATSKLEVILTYSNLHAVVAYRIAHWFNRMGMRFFARVISQFARFMTGVEIHPAARIGNSFFIDHGMGVVIGETTEVGDHVTLFQGVTLGGTGKQRGKRHPTIGDHVVIGAGANILGAIKIGDHVKVGANAVVLESVPPHSTVVGIPGKIVRLHGRKITDESMLDHEKMPDPTADLIKGLQRRIDRLESMVTGKDPSRPRKNNQAVKAGAIKPAPDNAETPASKPAKSRSSRSRSARIRGSKGGEITGMPSTPHEFSDVETVEERQARMAKMEKYEVRKTAALLSASQADSTNTQASGGGGDPKVQQKKRRKRYSKPKKELVSSSAGSGGSGRPSSGNGGGGSQEG